MGKARRTLMHASVVLGMFDSEVGATHQVDCQSGSRRALTALGRPHRTEHPQGSSSEEGAADSPEVHGSHDAPTQECRYDAGDGR